MIITTSAPVVEARDRLDAIRRDHPDDVKGIAAARRALIDADAAVIDSRADVETIKRRRPRDVDALAAARARFAAAELDACVRSVVGEAPPLTDEQRALITRLLRCGAARKSRTSVVCATAEQLPR